MFVAVIVPRYARNVKRIMSKKILSLLLLLIALTGVGCSAVELTQSATPTAQPSRTPRIVVVTATPSRTPLPPTLTPTPRATATPVPTATPFITPSAAGEPVEIPILMYHHLKPLGADASQTLRTWTVNPEQFGAQLDYLRARGFNTITFRELVDFFEQGTPLPAHPIILTFDDGWIDAYTVAFPELQKRGMRGVFFVPTNYATAGGELLMDWVQAIEMDRAGMEFGGHSISHEDLTQVNLNEARRQLVEGKAIMEEKLGHPITALSYPFGAYNPRIVAETQAAGYRAAVSLCCGYKQQSDMLYLLPRIRVSYDDSMEEFVARLP